MGDRGNIAVHFHDGATVYLYTHWRGYQVEDILRTALRKRWRWSDAPYLTRIIFEELVADNERGSETGYGIAPHLQDNEYPVLHVFPESRTVRIFDRADAEILEEFTFESFIDPETEEVRRGLAR